MMTLRKIQSSNYPSSVKLTIYCELGENYDADAPISFRRLVTSSADYDVLDAIYDLVFTCGRKDLALLIARYCMKLPGVHYAQLAMKSTTLNDIAGYAMSAVVVSKEKIDEITAYALSLCDENGL